MLIINSIKSFKVLLDNSRYLHIEIRLYICKNKYEHIIELVKFIIVMALNHY